MGATCPPHLSPWRSLRSARTCPASQTPSPSQRRLSGGSQISSQSPWMCGPRRTSAPLPWTWRFGGAFSSMTRIRPQPVEALLPSLLVQGDNGELLLATTAGRTHFLRMSWRSTWWKSTEGTCMEAGEGICLWWSPQCEGARMLELASPRVLLSVPSSSSSSSTSSSSSKFSFSGLSRSSLKGRGFSLQSQYLLQKGFALVVSNATGQSRFSRRLHFLVVTLRCGAPAPSWSQLPDRPGSRRRRRAGPCPGLQCHRSSDTTTLGTTIVIGIRNDFVN